MPLMVTVAVEVPPPVTEVGFSVTLAIPGVAVTDSGALADWPLAAAPMFAVTGVSVTVVVTVNVAVVVPAGTTTVVGTVAVPLLELRATVTPPVGAA